MSEEPRSEGNLVAGVAKTTLMVLGGLVAFGIVVSLLKPLALLAVVGGVGYLGYRTLKARRALPAADGAPKSLPPRKGGDDFEKRMRELEEAERALDAQIGKY